MFQSISRRQSKFSVYTPNIVLNADDDSAYNRWRDFKLENYISDPNSYLVGINDPAQLSPSEIQKLRQIIESNNFAIYEYSDRCQSANEGYRLICRQLGLTRSVSNPESDKNNVTTISNHAHNSSGTGYRSRYIPYTNHALNWHTDGYYNTGKRSVRSFVLHCLTAAVSGGENRLLDHEIAYILLRELNRDWAKALCDPNAFTIPANIQQGKVVRHAFTGPVFCTDPETGALYARYTERKFNVLWKATPEIHQAVSALKSILNKANGWIANIKLRPGQGIICNNVLHNRTAFLDNAKDARRLCRIRFSQRIHFDNL